ncbi:MAG: tRNA lysidine(34) synthetase TilS [Verrucomicrobiia bacterium]
MDEIEKKVLEYIRENGLIDPGETVVVGVSGGVDSVSLLYVLKQLSEELNVNLIVAHFNHCLRGNESEGDEQFVRELAQKMGLPVRCESGDVRVLVEKERMSVEMAARRLRHLFLARTAKENGSKKVALAHHLDDQIELFFLRLLRGSGPAGLCGMKPISSSPVDSDVFLIRPFLKLRKSNLIRYAQEKYLNYREDSTNTTGEYLRNKIRHELIPLLKVEYQHSLEKIILRQIEIFEAENDYILAEARKWLELKSVPFSSLHKAIQRKCIQIQLIELGIEAEFGLVEKLRLKPEVPVAIGQDYSITLGKDGVARIAPIQKQDSFFNQFLLSENHITVELDGGEGTIHFEDMEIKWSIIPTDLYLEGLISAKPQNVEYFDYEKVGKTVTLRHWKIGDRFKPIGFDKDIKLQDLFVNNKIPKNIRHSLVVAESEGKEIFWVEGLRISDKFKLTDKTKTALKWEWRRSVSASTTGLH